MNPYINLALMDNYVNTLHDKVLPNCLCRISIQKCIEARKKRSVDKKKEYDREYMRDRRKKN